MQISFYNFWHETHQEFVSLFELPAVSNLFHSSSFVWQIFFLPMPLFEKMKPLKEKFALLSSCRQNIKRMAATHWRITFRPCLPLLFALFLCLALPLLFAFFLCLALPFIILLFFFLYLTPCLAPFLCLALCLIILLFLFLSALLFVSLYCYFYSSPLCSFSLPCTSSHYLLSFFLFSLLFFSVLLFLSIFFSLSSFIFLFSLLFFSVLLFLSIFCSLSSFIFLFS